MKVADNNSVRFDTFSGGVPASMVYAAQRKGTQSDEHDSRGLIAAILLCMCCWAALGYFLLS